MSSVEESTVTNLSAQGDHYYGDGFVHLSSAPVQRRHRSLPAGGLSLRSRIEEPPAFNSLPAGYFEVTTCNAGGYDDVKESGNAQSSSECFLR
jgi:hypothetical protein